LIRGSQQTGIYRFLFEPNYSDEFFWAIEETISRFWKPVLFCVAVGLGLGLLYAIGNHPANPVHETPPTADTAPLSAGAIVTILLSVAVYVGNNRPDQKTLEILTMPRKPAPKPDNPEQFKRFTELAREVGADEQGKDFERVFDQIAKSLTRNKVSSLQ
jgi:hypothetical protein